MLVHETLGAFLGTYEQYMLFASTGGFDIVKIYTFESEQHIEKFIRDIKNREDVSKLSVVPIETNEKYVHVVDAIKAGYGDYLHDLVNNMQMISESVH